MNTRSPRRPARTFALLTLAAALAATACGSDDDSAEPAATDGPAAAATTGDMESGDMDMAMNMGDPDATPAAEVEGAAIARGDFVLLDTRPQGYDDLTGTAVIARHDAGTTVTVDLSGLQPGVDFIAHVHAEPCAPNNGGPHYQFDVGGTTVPPNEIHLAFTSDADGNGFMTAENHAVAGLQAVALVMHPAEFLDNKVACVDFVEDEPGAAAAAVDTASAQDA